MTSTRSAARIHPASLIEPLPPDDISELCIRLDGERTTAGEPSPRPGRALPAALGQGMQDSDVPVEPRRHEGRELPLRGIVRRIHPSNCPPGRLGVPHELDPSGYPHLERFTHSEP